ncbi:MerR family transcriptional regulator [Erysipelothrix sp. HDW6C]|uniref:MerR family transcriptional regulator n=1 Tax=Erysipelothrix sp. HDW6C TaxID=2714930 RepID=UPI00140C90E9|nr:MerR family transcriptional regulator [Erysipelothrix sp. HDW6C]QIK69625.1 MerR family transcriptional regulator [Erysipelothrix sp. HDW6C]
MEYTIKAFANLVKIPVRTLHYYDEINLLNPHRIDPANNYRYYSDCQIQRVNRIIYFKSMGIRLDEIKMLLAEDKVAHHDTVVARRVAELHADIMAKQVLVNRLQSFLSDRKEIPIAMVVRPELTVVSNRETLPAGADIYAKRFNKLMQSLKACGLQPIGPLCAWNHDDYRKYNPQSVDVEVYAEVSTSIEGVTKKIPMQRIVRLRHHGSYAEIPAKYAAMLTWMVENGFEYAGKTHERYIIDFAQTQDQEQFVTDLEIEII